MKNGGGQATLGLGQGRDYNLKVVLCSIVQVHHSHSSDHLLFILHVLTQKHVITLENTNETISYDSSSRSDCRITLNQERAI